MRYKRSDDAWEARMREREMLERCEHGRDPTDCHRCDAEDDMAAAEQAAGWPKEGRA